MLIRRHAGQTFSCVFEGRACGDISVVRSSSEAEADVEGGWTQGAQAGRVGLKAKDGRQISVSDGKTRGRGNEGRQHISYMIIQATLFCSVL